MLRLRSPDMSPEDVQRRRRITAVLVHCKRRAREEHVPYALTLDYVDSLCAAAPVCPITGLELLRGSKGDNRPSLDRVVPKLGYVPGNVSCISYAANRVKGQFSLEQAERLVAYIKGEL